MTHDVGTWDEITIKTPGMRANPAEINDFLRAVFPEDAVLPYQQRVAEAGIREAVKELRHAADRAVTQRDDVPEHVKQLITGLLDMLDPDSKEYEGLFPSRLVCPHHEPRTAPAYRQMEPVLSPCQGYPYCKGGIEIRGTRR